MLTTRVWAQGVRRDTGSVEFVNNRFERYRRYRHKFVAGWLAPEVLDVLAVLNSAQRSRNVAGPVGEIGVHHGNLLIGPDLLCRHHEYSVAIEIFDDQYFTIDISRNAVFDAFRNNLERRSSLGIPRRIHGRFHPAGRCEAPRTPARSTAVVQCCWWTRKISYFVK